MNNELKYEEILKFIKDGKTRQQVADFYEVSLSTIKRFLSKHKISIKKTVDRNKVLEMYNSNKTDKQIAKELQCSLVTIRKIIKDLGLSSTSEINKQKSKEKFLELYNKGYNDTEISKILGVNHVTIKNWREGMNLNSNFKYERKFDTNRFNDLYNLGYTYEEIAKELSVSSSAIADYGLSLGLTPNTCNKVKPTYKQEQIILGTLYGDAHLKIPTNGKNASGDFAHSIKQENYCKWKESELKEFTGYHAYKENLDKRTNNIYRCYYVRMVASTYFTEIYPKLYNNKIKYVNPELLYKLDGLGVAVWFMDDGFKEKSGYRIATNCFSDSDLQIIQKFFKDKFNINTSIHKNHVLYIKADSKDKFTDLIEPYIHEDLVYKLHCRTKTPLNGKTPSEDNSVLNPQEIEENA